MNSTPGAVVGQGREGSYRFLSARFSDTQEIMWMSIPDTQKKRGRPATGVTPHQGIRMSAELLAAIEEWRDVQKEPKPSRAEAIRQILSAHLKASGHLK